MKSNMKKIAILTSAHSAFDIRIFHKQARSLAKAGYDVTLIAQHDKNETVDCVKIICLPKPRNRLQRMFGLTLKILLISLKEKADIYHFHDPELIPIGIIFKIFGKKVIYDIHEDYPKSILTKDYLPLPIRGFISFILTLLEKLASTIFDSVIAATDSIKYRFPISHSIAIHNYPFILNTTSIKEASSEKQDSFFRIIHPGLLAEVRGINQILKALELINRDDVKLVLIGNFITRDYENYVRSLEAWKWVEYMGPMSHEDVMKNLIKADIGIECSLPIPNYLYAESNKVFEYMSVGLPVLCSNLPRLQEIIEDSICGVCVNPLDPEDIAKAIEYLLERPNLMKEMGRNGQKAVLEKYNWEQESEKLLKVYEKIANHKVKDI